MYIIVNTYTAPSMSTMVTSSATPNALREKKTGSNF
ncbi:hypothetical protein T4A_8176 [Trichinella pseudospiralis]|uniref:Uncharacterized protein n=1 Tax=Trichinella pseudospiralis TaxID=6337 RepID=A0A0V1DPR4_TRIPS|nr:hypothetical protein T4A_8176 [Trichinella pseudospiralis]